MAETQQDQQNQDQDNNKRATRRFALRLPVSVRYGENEQEHEAQTRDVSARGICFYVDSAIQAGSAIDFTLTLPPEITLTESIRVRCKGRVVRVEGGSPAGKMAVAAVIDEYDFLADVVSPRELSPRPISVCLYFMRFFSRSPEWYGCCNTRVLR